jgi:pyruvate/2-oxoglutarate dehydrogenase complex dihydrolipoamide dehydrogenase (E3) component
METPAPPLLPWDVHNQRLVDQVHPSNWVNPKPTGRYNLVVIGAGTAGLVAAAGAAGLGAKVALVERHFMGGDCLNVGCVPSKAILRAARAVAAVRDASQFGIRVPPGTSVDFSAVMERMRRLRADISPHDSARRFTELGVDVYLGHGRFRDRESIEVGGETLRFAKAVIATGARAAAPPIPGLEGVPYLTNETLFSLTELPRRLGIIGAGPIGCEMAQCFARLGSDVTLFVSDKGILPREDRQAAAIVEAALIQDGVRVVNGARSLSVHSEGTGIRLNIPQTPSPLAFEVDRLLVAAGRAPNVEELGLDTAGVQTTSLGVQVNDHLRTTNPRIYACGDVCSRFQFTHAADFMARMVIQNALFLGRAKASSLVIPWATYTSPELARVGLNESEASEQGIAVDTFTQEMAKVDRAILDGSGHGFVRVHVRRGTDEIVGATVVAPHAGELIGELTLALRTKVGLRSLGATIHPYPTEGEAVRKLGDLYNRTRLTPRVRSLMRLWLDWQR